LVHCKGKYQTLATLKREVSDRYTAEGGIGHLLHCRRRYQTLGTLQREVPASWYTAE